MFSILCEKHQAENRALYKEWLENNPDAKDSAGNRLLRPALAPVPGIKDCPDCRLVGLNKQGCISDLDSPDDWLFSHLAKE
jgi:hypothetical protein